jgi:hypothetical protein
MIVEREKKERLNEGQVMLQRVEPVRQAVLSFTSWLQRYGETSWDHQSYYAGATGRRAKALYYRNKYLGTMAVAPMVLSEALLPWARPLWHKRVRFPIADAHYAMGFGLLFSVT